jgi:hypothetical protein
MRCREGCARDGTKLAKIVFYYNARKIKRMLWTVDEKGRAQQTQWAARSLRTTRVISQASLSPQLGRNGPSQAARSVFIHKATDSLVLKMKARCHCCYGNRGLNPVFTKRHCLWKLPESTANPVFFIPTELEISPWRMAAPGSPNENFIRISYYPTPS